MEDILESAETTPSCCAASTATLTLKRAGMETDDVFRFGSPAVVGRFDPTVGPIDVDLGSIPEGQYVSRKHASIACDNGCWTVRDLGSSNGTFILRSDFERVEEADLEDGCEIAFGNARFVFRTGVCDCGTSADAELDEPGGPETQDSVNLDQG